MGKEFNCKDCGTVIEGTDCAYTLSRAKGWKKMAGCTACCPCGYPVRAKEVRDNIFGTLIDNNPQASGNAYIYCKNELN